MEFHLPIQNVKKTIVLSLTIQVFVFFFFFLLDILFIVSKISSTDMEEVHTLI